MNSDFSFLKKINSIGETNLKQVYPQSTLDQRIPSNQPNQGVENVIENTEDPFDKAEQLLREDFGTGTVKEDRENSISDSLPSENEFKQSLENDRVGNTEITSSNPQGDTVPEEYEFPEMNLNSEEIAEVNSGISAVPGTFSEEKDDKSIVNLHNNHNVNDDSGMSVVNEDAANLEKPEKQGENSKHEYVQQTLMGFEDIERKEEGDGNSGKKGVGKSTEPETPADPEELKKIKIIFVHGSVKEEIKDEFLSKTLDDYRKEVAKEIPSFEDKSKVSWKIEYAGTFKSVDSNITILAAKELTEKEKSFNTNYSKAKDKTCYVKATVQGQTKGGR